MNQRSEFIEKVLQLYLDLPDTPNRFSRFDRAIASSWFDQRIPIAQIQHAIVLAQVRRRFRPSTDPPLGPIRSLHYFAPILRELSHHRLNSEYFHYIQQKLILLKSKTPV